jgi:alpha-L-fucosidase
MKQAVDWSEFNRPTPAWFPDAKLGIFIHWGAYSVPAFGEPIGELGTMDPDKWFPHNPYAEWYFNTIRIQGSLAEKYHQDVYNGAPYDDFLDQWSAKNFDPQAWAQLFAHAGAQYVVPTTKHHDGIALWDAPGTGTRNTVHRGPKRDLIAEIAKAVRQQNMRFGVYYSGGLDWSITDLPPHNDDYELERPIDAAYSMYCYDHVIDIINKYQPEVIFNDINWPDFSKSYWGEFSLATLLKTYYEKVPTGLVNDRWGIPHSDYKTSEYKMNLHVEDGGVWENNRGVGYSFGFNKQENADHYLDLAKLLHHFIDIVSRGGNLLLNIGPTADGDIPELQQKVLRELGDWMKFHSEAIYSTRPVKQAKINDDSWVRWTGTEKNIYALVATGSDVELELPIELLDLATIHSLDNSLNSSSITGNKIHLTFTSSASPISAIRFNRK